MKKRICTFLFALLFLMGLCSCDNSHNQINIDSENQKESQKSNGQASPFWLYFFNKPESSKILYRISNTGELQLLIEEEHISGRNHRIPLLKLLFIEDEYIYYVSANQIRRNKIGSTEPELVRELELPQGYGYSLYGEYFCFGQSNTSHEVNFYHYKDKNKDFTTSNLPWGLRDMLVIGDTMYQFFWQSNDFTFAKVKVGVSSPPEILFQSKELSGGTVVDPPYYIWHDEIYYTTKSGIYRLNLDGTVEEMYHFGSINQNPIYTYGDYGPPSFQIFKNYLFVSEMYSDGSTQKSFHFSIDKKTKETNILEETRAYDESEFCKVARSVGKTPDIKEKVEIGDDCYVLSNTTNTLLSKNSYSKCSTIYKLSLASEEPFSISLKSDDLYIEGETEEQGIRFSVEKIFEHDGKLCAFVSSNDSDRNGIYWIDVERHLLGNKIADFKPEISSYMTFELIGMTDQ